MRLRPIGLAFIGLVALIVLLQWFAKFVKQKEANKAFCEMTDSLEEELS